MMYPLLLLWHLASVVQSYRISGDNLNDELAALFAKRFIQRRDVKAIQFDGGAYSPDRKLEELNRLGNYGPVGFQMHHLHQHLTGQATYGHYLLDEADMVRCFALDIDLRKNNDEFQGYYPAEESMYSEEPALVPMNPREDWLNRAHPGRWWTKTQFGMLARKLTATIQKELGIGTAAAYSGNKGIHVYGFTGPMPAAQARAAAHYAIEVSDDWVLERGQHIYQYKLQDPMMGYPNVNLEVYPKQDSLADKDLGNLLRLPLGVNRKNPVDPTFFIDLNTPVGVFAPHPNPVQLLETGNPYE